MRLDIRYRMVFEYDTHVREAHNEIRVRPQDSQHQRLLGYRLTPRPVARVLSFVDYWGTTVEHVGLVSDHRRFELMADAAVETRPRQALDNAAVSMLTDPEFRMSHAEFLTASPHVEWDDQIADLAKTATTANDDVVGAVDDLVATTRAVLSYQKATTSIGVSLNELLDGGSGVCQDFTHLTIGMLRSVGIPARYVSGYLFASDETSLEGADAEKVVVQTHAWVEAAVPGSGWHPVDPTNDRPVGERHVVIGHGRDYDDVAPVRGIYVGDGRPTVDASVEMRRMESADRSTAQRPRRRPPALLSTVVRPEPLDAMTQQQQQ